MKRSKRTKYLEQAARVRVHCQIQNYGGWMHGLVVTVLSTHSLLRCLDIYVGRLTADTDVDIDVEMDTGADIDINTGIDR